MLNLKEMTTRKGANLVFIFENQEAEIILDKCEYTQKEFRDIICSMIDDENIDPGENTTLYVLINTDLDVNFINEINYVKWQAANEKDWFHEKVHVILLDGSSGDVTME